MSDLRFYGSHYEVTSADQAFQIFMDHLRTYYDASYYVNWQVVFDNASKHERELALLSTLCDKPNKFNAAQELFAEYPKIIRALPQLIGCRGAITVMEDAAEGRMTTYNFCDVGPQHTEEQAKFYAQFLVDSGLVELLQRIKSVPDYVTGLEAGMDTHGRKQRSGNCASNALQPSVDKAMAKLPGLCCEREVSYKRLQQLGCVLPAADFKRQKWDWVFWTDETPRRFAVLEINHYGGTGSKPTSITGEYMARQRMLENTGVSFLWVTDGMGWHKMQGALRAAFDCVHHLLNIRLAAAGQLEWALQQALFLEPPRKSGIAMQELVLL